jgi:hypothetical protein
VSDSVILKTFPENKVDALTMLYLQSQNLSGLTPSELVLKYEEVHEEINNFAHRKTFPL